MPLWVDRTGLSKEELAKSNGLEPSYDVPQPYGNEDDEDERHLDRLIQTLLFPREMDRKLAGIRDQARTMYQEAGVNTLYAAFGFLEWREAKQSDKRHFAPLLLLPVSLEYTRGQPWGKYHLSSENPDVETNKTLEIRLGLDFGFQMPPFGDDDTPETFIEKVKEATSDHPDWRVRRFLTVGNFGFSKLPMYNDLDSANWPADKALGKNVLIRTLLVGAAVESDAPIFANDYSIDSSTVDDKKIALIADADASQHSAVIDAVEGKNLVIKGPPGTGKSQTITNIIAAALAVGKRVLFVSEKMAALEVVESRLKSAGLTDFCLQVHSSKTSKLAILESLRRRFELQNNISPPAVFDDKLAQLRDHRARLNRYVFDINECLGAMGLTVGQIFWGEIRAKADSGDTISLMRGIVFEGADGVDTLARSQAHSAIQGAFERAFEIAGQFGDLERHPWAWLRNESLNPFQIEALQDAGRDWLETLDRLSQLIEETESRFGPMNANSIHRLSQIIEAIAALHDPSEQFVIVLASSVADLDAQQTACEILELLGGKHDGTLERSSAFLTDSLPSLSENWKVKAQRISEALGTIERHCHGLHNYEQVRDQIAALQIDAERLGRVLEVSARVRKAAGLTSELTFNSVAVALITIGLLKEGTRELLLHRAPQILDETAEIPLSRAASRARELGSRRQELEKLIVLRPVPALDTVSAHTATLRGAGRLGFLNGRVREARRFFKSLARNPRQFGIAQMIDCGTKLATYLDDRQRLADERPLADACGKWFNGEETNFELLLEVNRWGGKVRTALSAGDECAPLRLMLLEGAADFIGGLSAAAELIHVEETLELLERLNCDGSEIEQAYAHLAERTEAMKAAIAVIEEEQYSSEAPFTVISDFAQRLGQLERLRARLAETSSSHTVTSSLLVEALSIVDRFEAAGLPFSILSALASDESESGFEDLRSGCRRISESLAEESGRRNAFLDVAEVDSDRLCDGNDLDGVQLSILRDRLNMAFGNVSGLKDYLALQSALAMAREVTPLQFVEKLIVRPPTSEKAKAVYDWLLFRGLGRSAFEANPDLNRFNGLDIQSTRKKFQELDREILELERERLRSKLCSIQIPYGNGAGRKSSFTNLALIENELGKKKRHIPLRQLFVRAAGAILRMKPCVMMSPLSVATYLQPGRFEFDMVVIDEASQMPPEDALGAIARSGQVVVVGDPMQLPPTSFFKRFDDVMDDDDEEEDEDVDVESVLDQAYAVFRPPRQLRWHYRSRDQSLIAFSNKHFYNDGLTVFPSPMEENENYGVHLIKVDGLYVDRHNPAEAKEMAAWAHEFMISRPNESLGLVAVNQLQRDLVMEEMRRIFQKDSQAEAYRRHWDDTLYPFFVKNLENVQGDERDVIAISLVRGPNADGKVTQNFGPISQKNGHRRLNVLFTRARNQLVVFSSITPEQIVLRPNTAQGPRVLRSFLDYALTGRLDPGIVGQRPPDSDFEVAVARRLQICGYEAVPQVGVGGFFIDLGVRHPEYPGSFLIGVECDGATYHSANSARDRDRLREEVLNGLGWKLYRIWSTDWFADPDAETDKLIRYIELVAGERRTLLSQVSARGAGLGSSEQLADFNQVENEQRETEFLEVRQPGDGEDHQVELFVDDGEEGRPDQTGGSLQSSRSSDSVVELGDTITFHFDDRPDIPRIVTIVTGSSEPDQNQISRDSPIGSALLGSSIGDDVEIDTPRGTQLAIVDDFSKSGTPAIEAPTPVRPNRVGSGRIIDSGTARTPESDAKIVRSAETKPYGAQHVYRGWNSNKSLPDPRDTQRSDVARYLREIIAAEGPVRVIRAYRLYSKACGIDRVGRVVRSKLNGALYSMVRQNLVLLEKEGPDDSQINAIARLPEVTRVSIRPAGDRTFWEIPPSELAAVLQEEQSSAPQADKDEIYHNVLARYDVGRLTTNIRSELARIERATLEGQFSA